MSLPEKTFDGQEIAVTGGTSGIGAALGRKAAQAEAEFVGIGRQQRDTDGGSMFA